MFKGERMKKMVLGVLLGVVVQVNAYSFTKLTCEREGVNADDSSILTRLETINCKHKRAGETSEIQFIYDRQGVNLERVMAKKMTLFCFGDYEKLAEETTLVGYSGSLAFGIGGSFDLITVPRNEVAQDARNVGLIIDQIIKGSEYYCFALGRTVGIGLGLGQVMSRVNKRRWNPTSRIDDLNDKFEGLK